MILDTMKTFVKLVGKVKAKCVVKGESPTKKGKGTPKNGSRKGKKKHQDDDEEYEEEEADVNQ
jgi:hypothetical protein